MTTDQTETTETPDVQAAWDAYAAARMAHPSWPGHDYHASLAPVDVSARPRRFRLTRRGENVLIGSAIAIALAVLAFLPTEAPANTCSATAPVHVGTFSPVGQS